ncbi:glycoside hydrolase family 2 protein [Leptobacterium flavescens]|uniref:Beta-mannosidase B n=1 Tax=Leptobacterium flavescens TaxID=472055 RepID=A0A6P0UNU9_9FLAO|nr:glycoside hydrolase family 2 protein [Leptobacterium flavescens]NER14172.1 glycoside hydrolase family 2 protein [Leptobacterium flavescens]
MIYRFAFLLFAGLCFLGCKKQDKTVSITDIHDSWQFKETAAKDWNTASIPATVHSNLLENQMIDDPFVGDNEFKLQWISEKDWEYKTTFEADASLRSKKHIELHFDGLDTYASVYLNDSLILEADNAFRRWKKDVKKILRDKNSLRIVFKNATEIEEVEKAKLYYELPEGNRVFSRKPQFHYGWDWGPKFITSGISGPVQLKAWDDLKVEDIFIRQEKMDNERALLTAEIELTADESKTVTVEVKVNGDAVSSHEMQLRKGRSDYRIPFEIEDPQWWWTHNLGDPYLYDIQVNIFDSRALYASKTIRKGLRTIELVTQEEEGKKAFYFKLNGVPVFMKGANYIPQNSFQDRVKKEDYERLLSDAVKSNMNMLRVWGGGIYEKDIFYDLCDEKGILLWQDFMFACAMYPGDEAFLQNVKEEAIDNIKRLRNHSSIALWCGNNENSEGWARWGWQAGKSEEQKERIWGHYQAVFNGILPEQVKRLTDDIPYWESSPKYGRGDERYISEGDAHDWWVWHDAYPFEHFEENVPRFMSEFGFQGFPSYKAIKYVTQSDSIDISGKNFVSHQKHSRGFQLIREYMERDFPVPDTDEDYVYVSQLLQAYGIGKGIEAQRRAMPYCMGSLYWQLNDCWPVVSWSGIDGLGEWKALQYTAKHAFEDLLLSSRLQQDTLEINLVNDALSGLKGDLKLSLIDFEGKELWKTEMPAEVGANESKLVYRFPLSVIGTDRKEVALKVDFNGKERVFYFVKPKELGLKRGKIERQIQKKESGYEIVLTSDTLQKDVFLYTDTEGHFEDNFFDLLPGTEKRIQFSTQADLNEKDLHLKTLNKIIDSQ